MRKKRLREARDIGAPAIDKESKGDPLAMNFNGGFNGREILGRKFQFAVAVAAMVAMAALMAQGAWAQKKSKEKKAPLEGQPMPELPIPAPDQIDHAVGEMLGAFQVGDIEAMHKYYADNATFVSGAYEPPIAGWQNYAAAYDRQRASFQGMQLIRRNTVVFSHSDVAWVSYQWEFLSLYNDKPYSARGQTTLVLNKIGDKWLIVHNHTSQVCDSHPPAAQHAAQTSAQNPAGGAPQPSKP